MFCDENFFCRLMVVYSCQLPGIQFIPLKNYFINFKFFFQIRDGVGRPRVYLKIIFFL
jgi:hypothetical protein